MEPSSRPQRVSRALCLLGGFDDAEYATYLQRRQDLYKSSQLCERTKTMLTRKEKDFKVKVLLTQKQSKKRRGGVREKLQERDKQIQEKMAAEKVEQPSCSKSLDELVMRRKISPAISIVNPLVINLIRLKKRRKYIKIF